MCPKLWRRPNNSKSGVQRWIIIHNQLVCHFLLPILQTCCVRTANLNILNTWGIPNRVSYAESPRSLYHRWLASELQRWFDEGKHWMKRFILNWSERNKITSTWSESQKCRDHKTVQSKEVCAGILIIFTWAGYKCVENASLHSHRSV